MRLIIGLGNPDKEYEHTRHNFGQMSVNSIVEKKGLSWKKNKKTFSFTADWPDSREKIILAKPELYMNESGKAVRALKSYYKLPTNKIIVIYDDIDLPLGKLRLSKGRGDGGHRGIESIIEHLKSKDFKRIRLGIGPQQGSAEDFVLKKFSPDEKKKIPEVIDTSHLVIETILNKDFDHATNKYN